MNCSLRQAPRHAPGQGSGHPLDELPRPDAEQPERGEVDHLDAVRVGPIRKQAQDVVELLSDPARCQVLLVTIPEETPVSELIDTAFAIEDRAGVALGPVVVNGCFAPLGTPAGGFATGDEPRRPIVRRTVELRANGGGLAISPLPLAGPVPIRQAAGQDLPEPGGQFRFGGAAELTEGLVSTQENLLDDVVHGAFDDAESARSAPN